MSNDLRTIYPDDLADIRAIPKRTILRDWFQDGLRIVIVRSNCSMNVYLGVSLHHPLAGHDYDDLPVDCHGGLTYSAEGDGEYLPTGYWWYGYDYAHSGDYPWHDSGTPDFMEHDKKWTLKEIEDETFKPRYDMVALMRLAEKTLRTAPNPAPMRKKAARET